MKNALIFLFQSTVISCFAVIATRMGKSALVSFISLVCVLANLFVIKQITLFGFDATCSDAFTVGSVLGLNLLQEYYGKAIARKSIWISFCMLIFYTIVSQIHLWYTPSIVDFTQQHYKALLSYMPRITIASLLVFLFVQHVDYYLYGYLKNKLSGQYIVLRNYGSIIFSQLLDTVLFSFAGLYGIVDNIWSIILVSYSIKLLAIVLTGPFVYFVQKIMFQKPTA